MTPLKVSESLSQSQMCLNVKAANTRPLLEPQHRDPVVPAGALEQVNEFARLGKPHARSCAA